MQSTELQVISSVSNPLVWGCGYEGLRSWAWVMFCGPAGLRKGDYPGGRDLKSELFVYLFVYL